MKYFLARDEWISSGVGWISLIEFTDVDFL